MRNAHFQILVLGCSGGPREINLSSYLLSPCAHPEWIALDAGSLLSGIETAWQEGSLRHVHFDDPHYLPTAEFLRSQLRGYLISHAHLDHLAGLILNSPLDLPKFIAGLGTTIDSIRDHLFNGKIWPNYGSEGNAPLGKYQYLRLPVQQPQALPHTSFQVEAFVLNHPHTYTSTAFLVEQAGQYLLYFGDTGSDLVEPEKRMDQIWQRVTPLIQTQKLHGILLECSFLHLKAAQRAFGHLDASLLLHSLRELRERAGGSLAGVTLIVTHRKESLLKGEDTPYLIQETLLRQNDLGIPILFPKQGERITL